MTNNNLKEILLEEIALEGLDGITVDALCLRLRERREFPLTVNEESLPYIWRCVLGLHPVQFYKLQQPRPELVPYNRAHFIDPETTHFIETEHLPDDIYDVAVVEEEGVLGSCPDYKTRENITESIREGKQPINVIREMYGNSLVVVANQDVRVRAIVGPDSDPLFYLPNSTFCVLERIARSRYNGETSIGRRSLQVLKHTTKGMFYQMKKLRHIGALKKQRLCAIKKPSNIKLSCVLYHLKRFYRRVGNKQQLDMLSMVEYLSKEPDLMAEPYKLKNYLKIYDKDFKKLSHYTVGRERIFEFVDIPYREIHPDAKPKDYMIKSGKTERNIRYVRLLMSQDDLKRIIDQQYISEDEEEEEDEEDEEESQEDQGPVVSFQREYDRPFMFQIIELLKASGALGMSQVDLQHVLQCNKLTARRTVNLLLRGKHVTTVMKDRGRQKVVMYVSVENAKKNLIHQSFHEEMNKFGSAALIEHVADQEPYKKRKSEKVRAAEKRLKEEALSATINEEPLDGEKISQIHKELDKVDESFSPKLSSLTKETQIKKELLRQIVSEDGTLIQVKLEETNKFKPGTTLLGLKRFGSMLSASHIRRINWIIEVVNAIKVVETFRILKLLRNREKDMDIKHSMDSKSLKRLVVALTEEGKLRSFHAQIKMEGKTKDMTYLCSPEVNEKDEFLLRIVEEAKLRYFSVSKEQLAKRKELNREAPKPLRIETTTSGIPGTAMESIQKHQAYRRKLATTCPPMKYNRRAGLKYGLLPKMLRIQAAHQYLFHLCYDTYGNSVLSEGGVSINPKKTSDFDVTTMNAADKVIQPEVSTKQDIVWPTQDPPVYFDEWTWRRYLPPLPVHAGYPVGWCLLSDVLLRLPVYLFCQIVNVCYDIAGLEDILNDSQKKFYPIINLPWKISQQLLHSKKYVHSFMELCGYLCEMGLLSYGKEFLKEIEQTFVFVHQNGSVLDTRDSLEGYNKTKCPEGCKFTSKSFHFEKLSDLHDYWENLQIIALASNMGFKSKTHDDLQDTEDFGEKSLKIASMSYSPDEIVDNAVIPGDRRGAAGIDSSLFVHCLKNWTFRSLSKTAIGEKTWRTGQVPAFLKGGLDMSNKLKVVDMYNKDLKLIGKERLVLTDDPKRPVVIKKVTRENVKGNRGGKGIKRSNASKRVKAREDGRLRLKRVTDYKPPRPKKKKPSEKGDDKDRMIYGNKTKQRVVWSTKEDSVLLMCRLATFIMDDNRKTSIVSYPVIRDFIHEHCGPISHDKTSQACNRRLVFVLKNKPTENNLLLYFREAMQDEYIVKKFVAKRFVCTDPAIVTNFKKLTEYLIEKFQSLNVQKCELPATLKELKTLNLDPIEKLTKVKIHHDATSREEICKDVLRNILHSAVLLQDKQGRTHEMFKLLTQYPDILLSEVIKELRLDGLFVMQKKNYQRDSMSQLSTGMGLRNFKVSQRYMYNYKHRYLSTLFEESADFLDKLYNSYLDGKGVTLDFHPIGGQSAILIPLVLQKMLTFKIEIPDELVVIDMDGFYNFPWGRGKIGTTKADKSLQELYTKKNLIPNSKSDEHRNVLWGRGKIGTTKADKSLQELYMKKNLIPNSKSDEHRNVGLGKRIGEIPAQLKLIDKTKNKEGDEDEVAMQDIGGTLVNVSNDTSESNVSEFGRNSVSGRNLSEESVDNKAEAMEVQQGEGDATLLDEISKNKTAEAMETEESTEVTEDVSLNISDDKTKQKETGGIKSNMDDNSLSSQPENNAFKESNKQKDTEGTKSNMDDNSLSSQPDSNAFTESNKQKYEVFENGSSTIRMPIPEVKSSSADQHVDVGVQSSLASRTLLSLRRAEDTTKYSFEDIRIFNAQDNFVVKSCAIEVKLRGDDFAGLIETRSQTRSVVSEKGVVDTVSVEKVNDNQPNLDNLATTNKSSIVDKHASVGIIKDNQSNSHTTSKAPVIDEHALIQRLMLDKPKMKKLWSEMQRLLPFKLDMCEVWKSMTDNDGVSVEKLDFYKQIYQIIDDCGELGVKMYDLQKQFDTIHWKEAVRMLIHYAAACPLLKRNLGGHYMAGEFAGGFRWL